MSAPTPAIVDAKAVEYYGLKDALDRATEAAAAAKVPLDELKKELIELVQSYGSPHAEKSKLLHGITQEIMGTFGSSTSYDAAAIEQFRLALKKADQTRLLKRIFVPEVRWALAPDYAAIIKGSVLSKPLLALYSQIQVTRRTLPR